MKLEEYLSLHPKKYLIFDLDETLARLEIDWSTVHQMLFREIKKIDQSLVSEATTNAREFYNLINTTASKHGTIAKQAINKAIEIYEQKNYSSYTPNSDLLLFIHSHVNTYTFSLWTSNSIYTIQDFLHQEHLKSIFRKIIALEDVLFTKPNPDGFSRIYEQKNLKTDYLMIGDSENDEGAAKNAGIDFFKIDYFTRQEAP